MQIATAPVQPTPPVRFHVPSPSLFGTTACLTLTPGSDKVVPAALADAAAPLAAPSRGAAHTHPLPTTISTSQSSKPPRSFWVSRAHAAAA
jgi:hypothetical protein